ncbi:MAG TPA: cysteine desulfurase-like protein [Anaerolineales bacterium]|nr:cysteine desulfurase-like protein [Anaerolineales bacterium]
MFNSETIRAKFPGLAREAVFFDNPAGTQMVQSSIDRMTQYMIHTNANHGGVFATSHESDAMVHAARQMAADFLEAGRPDEIVFGPNMTSLTLNLSRSLARTFSPGDTIVVTRMDHDANITPWTLIAEDGGLNVEWVDFDVETGLLKLETLEAALEKKPKLVAVGYASNALGTINPVKQITRMAHDAGALVYIDAVQYAPHGPIDVRDLDADFLVCSAYKFYGPHIGVLYGKYDLLDELKAYKVRPASNLPPEKFETGTASFEGIAGTMGAMEHLAWIAETYGQPYQAELAEVYGGQALALKTGMAALQDYESGLTKALLETLHEVPGIIIYGQDDPEDVSRRVPTVTVNLEGLHPRQVSKALAEQNIYVWDGNYYALAVTERLGVEESGGMVRIGAAQYNTLEEIERLGKALTEMTRA